jgi:hypothetical protein
VTAAGGARSDAAGEPSRDGAARPEAEARSRLHRGLRLARWCGLALLVCAPAEAQRELGWELRVAEHVDVAVGATAPLTIALAVDRGLTVSKDAAVILDLAPDPGLTVKKKRLGRGDAVDPEADAPRFAVGVRGDAPGDHVLRLHARFWLCGRTSCRPIDVRRVATVAVGAMAPPADAGADAASDGGAPADAARDRRRPAHP